MRTSRDGSARLGRIFTIFWTMYVFGGLWLRCTGPCPLETSVITIVPRAPGEGSVGVECLRRARGRGRVASAR